MSRPLAGLASPRHHHHFSFAASGPGALRLIIDTAGPGKDLITDVKKEREKKLKRVDGGKEILLRRRKEEKTSFLLSAFRCAAVLKNTCHLKAH